MSYFTQAALEQRILDLTKKCTAQTQRGNDYFDKFQAEQKARLTAEAELRKLRTQLHRAQWHGPTADNLVSTHCAECGEVFEHPQTDSLCGACKNGRDMERFEERI